MIDNPFGITHAMVFKSMSEASKAMRFFIHNFKKKHNVKLSGKLLSETFSNLLEQKCGVIFSQELGYLVVSAKGDNDSDLFFTKIKMPMEIKVTSGEVWRGGEFSKRAAYHLMVSRNDEFDEFFAALVNMQQDGGLWVSAMQKGKHYYAPSLKKDQLYNIRDKIAVFIGGFEVKDKGGKKTIKLVRESLNQKTLLKK